MISYCYGVLACCWSSYALPLHQPSHHVFSRGCCLNLSVKGCQVTWHYFFARTQKTTVTWDGANSFDSASMCNQFKRGCGCEGLCVESGGARGGCHCRRIGGRPSNEADKPMWWVFNRNKICLVKDSSSKYLLSAYKALIK